MGAREDHSCFYGSALWMQKFITLQNTFSFATIITLMLAQVCTVLWQLRGNVTHLLLHLIFKSILGCVGIDVAAVIIISPG